jgi:hypothetical protein
MKSLVGAAMFHLDRQSAMVRYNFFVNVPNSVSWPIESQLAVHEELLYNFKAGVCYISDQTTTVPILLTKQYIQIVM